ncbi:hypothetical protein KR99_22245, partial [Ralstonia solanacearum]
RALLKVTSAGSTRHRYLRLEIRQTNQALIIKQGEITQLNTDGAQLVAEIGSDQACSRTRRAR